MADIDINWHEIDKAVAAGFKDTVYQYAQEVTKVISQPRFWDGFGDVRDIVDKGQLRASQVVEFDGALSANISYRVDYALIVHTGYTRVSINGKVVRIAPRPFMRIAADQMNVEKAMASNIKYRLSKIRA